MPVHVAVCNRVPPAPAFDKYRSTSLRDAAHTGKLSEGPTFAPREPTAQPCHGQAKNRLNTVELTDNLVFRAAVACRRRPGIVLENVHSPIRAAGNDYFERRIITTQGPQPGGARTHGPVLHDMPSKRANDLSPDHSISTYAWRQIEKNSYSRRKLPRLFRDQHFGSAKHKIGGRRGEARLELAGDAQRAQPIDALGSRSLVESRLIFIAEASIEPVDPKLIERRLCFAGRDGDPFGPIGNSIGRSNANGFDRRTRCGEPI